MRIRRVDGEEPIGNRVGNKLVIDNAGIVVVDNAVFTDEELGGLGFFHLSIRSRGLTELGVGLENVRDIPGGVELRNVDDVSTAGSSELVLSNSLMQNCEYQMPSFRVAGVLMRKVLPPRSFSS